MTWEESRERLNVGGARAGVEYIVVEMPDIRAALELNEHLYAQIDALAKFILATCPEEITSGSAVDVAIKVIAALRQRVEELERAGSTIAAAAERFRQPGLTTEARLARCVEALEECQRVFDHPAFTDRAGIGDVCRAALAAAKGGE